MCLWLLQFNASFHDKYIVWLVTAPIIILVLVHVGFSVEIVVLMFVSQRTSTFSQLTFRAATPSLTTAALADVLIMVSLCVFFYDGSSGSAFPRTKRLLNTLITLYC